MKLIDSMRTDVPESDNIAFYDTVFENEINRALIRYIENFEKLILREVIIDALYNFQHKREDYRLNVGNHGFRRDLVIKYVKLQLLMLYPVAPHFSEVMWKDFFYPCLSEDDKKNMPATCSEAVLPEV